MRARCRLHRRALALLPVWVACLSLAGGCEGTFQHDVADAQSDAAPLPRFAGKGVNQVCKATTDCRVGLACTSGKCKPVGKTPKDGACLLTAECLPNMQCGWSGFCSPAGQMGVGESCVTAVECLSGLQCLQIGVAGECHLVHPGAKDIGGKCQNLLDCLPGLACSPERMQCVAGSLVLYPDLFPGVECADDEEAEQSFQGVFRVPRQGKNSAFYDLPFPNDLRLKDGFLDLSDHPRPGPGVVGFDAVDRVAVALGSEAKGFGLSTGIYLRFNRELDPTSLSTHGLDPAVRLIRLTPGAVPPIDVSFLAARDKYMCGNRIYVRPRGGMLLEPDTTYAVLVTDAIRPAVPGPGALPSADLLAVLAPTPPDDPALQPAWKQYAGVRASLPGLGLNPRRVVQATVFTTGHPLETVKALNQAAEQAPLAKLSQPMVRCSPGVTSPCATPGWAQSDEGKAGLPDPRGCPLKTSNVFNEFHVRLQVPVWQHGTRPYLEEGGGLQWQGGLPVAAGTENVCMAVTIPKTAMPVGGWPVVLFAHGTNGSFRSGADMLGDGLGTITLPTGAEVHVATLTLDMPMHGPRRGADIDPGQLVYNIANPVASRGGFLQGAADLVALQRWAIVYQGLVPGVDGVVRFDPNHMIFMGHSQGGTTGPAILPYRKGIAGAVFSGAGGSLIHGLLGKTKPIDTSLGLRFVLQELNLDERHPVLNLMATYFEPVDPQLSGHLLHAAPLSKPLPTLQFYGHDDHYTPPVTTRLFAAAMQGVMGAPDPLPKWFDAAEDLGMVTAKLPISMGVLGSDGSVTWGVTVQYQPVAANAFDGLPYDGHFVAFNDKSAFRQLQLFVASLVQGKPVVAAP
ncbi:MAG: hypothetical protein ACOYOB_14630 [Myxococcota bacterium]